MAERIWNRLHCPCFDLTWAVFSGGAADPSPKAESADTAKSPIPVKAVALVPGGGGSAKSGVKNQIVIHLSSSFPLYPLDPQLLLFL
jgi:hypothetical protein